MEGNVSLEEGSANNASASGDQKPNAESAVGEQLENVVAEQLENVVAKQLEDVVAEKLEDVVAEKLEDVVAEKLEDVVADDADATTTKNKKKKKKAKAKADAQAPETDVADDEASASGNKVATEDKMRGLQKALEMLAWHSSSSASGAGSSARSLEEAKTRNYSFWSTQPVPKIADRVESGTNEPIEEDKPIDAIRAEPYTLPAGFGWFTMDLSDQAQLDELYCLLTENYVEDDDCMFRFDYSRDFLRWALHPPEWRKDWHCGMRADKSGRLVGFISAVPCSTRIYDSEKRLVEINFLCVHKKLRSKRMAPVLIREITRRVNLTGLFQAVYTAGAYLPKPVGTCRYWHRSLNPKKLVECRFSHLGKNMTMQRTIKLYKLPDAPKLRGFCKMTKQHVHSAWKLLAQYLRRFDLAPVFNEEEFEHWMMPRENIVDSFVVADEAGEVTDFVSFYTLSSSVMNNPQHKSIKAAYLFYYASRAHMNSLQVAQRLNEIQKSSEPQSNNHEIADLKRAVQEGNERLKAVVNDALTCAKQLGFDVFNALDLMDNKVFLEDLKFGVGDGNLNYYIYNWRCAPMNSEQIAVVLQ